MAEAPGLDRGQWEEKLTAVGAALRAMEVEAEIEIIGAWPVIAAGMPGRTSLDLDVWMPGSKVDRGALRAACEAAGLDFDPLEETDRPYLQLIQPGIVQVPEHVPQTAGTWGGLKVTAPPPAALAAAKLTRAQPKDLADVAYLCRRHGIRREEVGDYVEKIGMRSDREAARENLVYLQLPDPEK